jgi:hypothetical protein
MINQELHEHIDEHGEVHVAIFTPNKHSTPKPTKLEFAINEFIGFKIGSLFQYKISIEDLFAKIGKGTFNEFQANIRNVLFKGVVVNFVVREDDNNLVFYHKTLMDRQRWALVEFAAKDASHFLTLSCKWLQNERLLNDNKTIAKNRNIHISDFYKAQLREWNYWFNLELDKKFYKSLDRQIYWVGFFQLIDSFPHWHLMLRVPEKHQNEVGKAARKAWRKVTKGIGDIQLLEADTPYDAMKMSKYSAREVWKNAYLETNYGTWIVSEEFSDLEQSSTQQESHKAYTYTRNRLIKEYEHEHRNDKKVFDWNDDKSEIIEIKRPYEPTWQEITKRVHVINGGK